MPLANNLRWLYLGRALRSCSTAFLTVVFPLYLAHIGYSAARIGLLLTGSGAITLGLVAAVGLFADRHGRKTAILGLALLSAVGGLLMALTPAFWVALVASGLGGVGRGGGAGSGGSWGPMFPAEQPLVAGTVSHSERTHAFGVLSFVGVLAGAVGSLVAGVPDLLHAQGVPLLEGYRLLFLVSAALSLGVVAATLPIVEPRDSLVQGGPPPALNLGQLLGRLGVTNALNGLGVGLLGPLLTYWFYRRYGVGAAEVGVLYTVVNLAAAVPYLGSSALTRRLGTIRTVAITRFGSAVTLFVMAAMPSFALAGLLYTLRMMLNSLGMPARQSYVMGVSEHRYRSRVSAFGNLPSQVTATIVPALAGSVMGSFIDAPILGSAFFIGMNALAYYVFFRKAPPPEEQTEAAAGAASHRST